MIWISGSGKVGAERQKSIIKKLSEYEFGARYVLNLDENSCDWYRPESTGLLYNFGGPM